MPRMHVTTLAILLGLPLAALAQPGNAVTSAEPFKVGTFVIGNTRTTGMVLRDSLVVDLVAANAAL